MHDQANELRHLVSRQTAEAPPRLADRSKLVVVAGGKGGAGTTTLAVNLAAALARAGRAVTLVDADPSGGDLVLLCCVQERYTIADVLAGRCTVAEALEAGPAGAHVLAGSWELAILADAPPAGQQRLIEHLQCMPPRPDWVVVDTGNGWSRWARRWWQAADQVLMVTTPELASVMDTYAAIKILAADGAARVDLVVNRVDHAEDARDVRTRLSRVCQRFLAIEPGTAGFVPSDPMVAAAAAARQPFVLASPGGPAATHLEQLAAKLASEEGDASRTTRKIQPPAGQTPIPRNSLGIGPLVKLY